MTRAAGVDDAGASPRLSVEEDGIAHLVFDAPDRSANILTSGTMQRLAEILRGLREACAGGEVRGVLVSSRKPTFIVGADIGELAAVRGGDAAEAVARVGHEIFLELEELPVPTVAAIHGACMGGGTELALACDYRVASDHPKTRIGLPEVRLGILPAWGGTTRLPRLVGLRSALEPLLSARPLRGSEAKRIGLVDDLLPHPGFPEHAARFLRERIPRPPSRPRRRATLADRLLVGTPPARRLVLRAARRRVIRKTGGHYPAPLRILDVLGRSVGRPPARGFEAERRAARDLIGSPVSRNLIHLFHLQQRARKGLRRVSEEPPAGIGGIGVVGAGTMGGAIAQLAASRGHPVQLVDIRREAVSGGLARARSLFDSAVRTRRMTPRQAARGMERIRGSLDYTGFGTLDLVIEAVAERISVKREVLGKLEAAVGGTCLLATNTSSLSVSEMARGLTRPERFLGMHFFNPVHRMPLVEIVRGPRTDGSAVAAAYALSLAMGKLPVVVGDSPGFLVNRILAPYLNEAGHLLGEGASIGAVDRAATAFGMAMGPLRLIDEVGIEVAARAGENLRAAHGERLAQADALARLGAAGRRGRKGGSGFYRYRRGREAGPDPGAYEAVGTAGRSGPGPPPEVVRDRLLLPMVNEAARALSEGVTPSARDLDLAMITGAGFPAFRGGLLRHADREGLPAVVRRLQELERSSGSRFAPAALLSRLAEEGRGFHDAFPE